VRYRVTWALVAEGAARTGAVSDGMGCGPRAWLLFTITIWRQRSINVQRELTTDRS